MAEEDYGYSDGGGPHPDGWDPPPIVLLIICVVIVVICVILYGIAEAIKVLT